MQDFVLYLPGILLSYAAFLLAIASPGPNVLAVIGTSMSVGRSSGMALAFGVSAGSFTWGILTAFGLSAIVASYVWALFAIKIFGGLYLLWLAYKSFKQAASSGDINARELAGGHRTRTGYFQRGFVIQMTNPKAALAWIAIISLGLKDGAPLWVSSTIVLGTLLLSVIFHTLYALAFSTPTAVRIYGRARRGIQGVLGAFFAFAGLRMLLNRS